MHYTIIYEYILHLNLRHLAVQGVEEQRQHELVQVLLGALLQDDRKLLQERDRGLDALRIIEDGPITQRAMESSTTARWAAPLDRPSLT